MYTHTRFHSWYNGSPQEKLSQARILLAYLGQPNLLDPGLRAQIELLRSDCLALARKMTAMDLGRLCSHCAARPGGGCCSAYMADNTDSILILINLLLGMEIAQREPADCDCCFLGPSGCLFMAKPIFCLNYNCTHIVNDAGADALAQLEQCAAVVLSRQTGIEALLLERLRPCFQ